MRIEAEMAATTALNPYFDTSEVQALLQALAAVNAYPNLASTGTEGAVKRLNDPGLLTAGQSTDVVIAYLNDLRDKLIAAGMLEGGQGGGS